MFKEQTIDIKSITYPVTYFWPTTATKSEHFDMNIYNIQMADGSIQRGYIR